MEETLVTVAIHTYERAQVLKSVLEMHGIDVYIHSVNPIIPAFSVGVRVRIKQSDLAKALSIIDNMQSSRELQEALEEMNKQQMILLPIDFSDYSVKTCEFGVRLAARVNAEVVLIHTYSTPTNLNAMVIGEVLNYETKQEEAEQKQGEEHVKQCLAELEGVLQQRMDEGSLPQVKFRHVLRTGVPEDQILSYSDRHHPLAIVMGTRGSNQKDVEMIGSVTAEVIERSHYPVFAVPDNAQVSSLDSLENIAYSTNFNDEDLLAFEKLMKLVDTSNTAVHFIHYDTKDDNWAEIKLGGIKEYFQKNYPNLKTDYQLLKGEGIQQAYDRFIKESHIDLLCLTTHRRNIFARLFNPSMAKKLAFHTDTPMLVFHA